MKYTAFKIKNFKGINETIEINLSDDTPLCLIGGNESGKTTILKAIELIGMLCKGHRPRNGELSNTVRPKRGFLFTGDVVLETSVIFDAADLNKQFRKKSEKQILERIKSANGKANIRFTYTYENDSIKNKDHLPDIQITSEENKSDSVSSDILQWIKTVSPDIVYLDDFIFRIPSKIRYLRKPHNEPTPEDEQYESYVKALNDNNLKSDQNQRWQRIFDDILKGAIKSDNSDGDGNLLYKATQIWSQYITNWTVMNPNDQGATKQRILAAENFIFNEIFQEWEDISGIKSNFTGFSIDTEQDDYFHDYSLYIKDGKNSFRLSERSKGFQWYFCFMILTKIRSYRDSMNHVFLLDEPASNLHIYPQWRVLNILKKLSKSKQVIYTTHTPHLIDEKGCDSISVVDNGKTSETSDMNITIFSLEEAFKNKDNEKVQHNLTPFIVQSIIPRNIHKKIWEQVKNVSTIANISEKLGSLINLQ